MIHSCKAMDASYKEIWGQMNNTTTEVVAVSAKVLKLKLKGKCYRCGMDHSRGKAGCHVKTSKHHWCGKKGHFARVCLSKDNCSSGKSRSHSGNTGPHMATTISISTTATTGIAVFHLTVTWLPMASAPYQWASDFQKYSPSLVSAKVERKWKNLKKILCFFQKFSFGSHVDFDLPKAVVSCILIGC